MSCIDESAKYDIQSDDQLVRILQLNLKDEEEASANYDKLIESTSNQEVKDLITEIRNDEYDHIQKLNNMIKLLKPEYEEGTGESKDVSIDNEEDTSETDNTDDDSSDDEDSTTVKHIVAKVKQRF